jgi:DNA-directed RNA polymerase subunit beta'
MKLNEDILELEKSLLKLENLHASFDYLRVSIASPSRIRNWAERKLPNGEIVGEVLKGETINFRTHQPEIHGLFCEKIFGPIKNWKCKCGKYNGFILDKVCEECNVEIIEARVRRYRMGFIELTCPITHLWYLKGVPNYLCILLRTFSEKLTVSDIEQIVYFKEGERIISKNSPFYPFFYPEKKREFLNELNPLLANDIKNELNKVNVRKEAFSTTELHQKYSKERIPKRRLGSEILKAALESINLEKEIKKARNFIDPLPLQQINFSVIAEKSLIRRIRILESFLATKMNPSWLILTILPVLPPNLRPLLELESGRLVAADVNEIYRLILTRNQRLFDFLYEFVAPDLITIHGRKLLQEGVDSLIDNSRLPKEKTFSLNNKALKSLTEILEGKQGRFRQSLLGKRVDYSGRSVIIVGPNLRLNQCGLPYEMALELFQPFLMNELLKTKIKAPSHNTKLANVIIKKNKPFIWLILSSLMKKHAILLNRAPTLHRFGIQAFDPVLILGQAIHLHPLVCTGFNADFDGDQMAVHLPLYEASQLEARTLMRPSFNLISPSNSEVILKPTQDIVIGCYYLTLMIKKYSFVIKKWFSNEKEALSAFYQKKIEIHTPILVHYSSFLFEVKLENDKLYFYDSLMQLDSNSKEIILLKIFPVFLGSLKKYFIITNIGIFSVFENEKQRLYITDLFLETTPGRLIFSMNIKNSLKTNL